MARWCWVTSSAGASYNMDTVGQEPTALAVGAGGGCLYIFILIYPFPPLSPSLWETARYRLKYCLKGPLKPKQPTNQFNFKAQQRAKWAAIQVATITTMKNQNRSAALGLPAMACNEPKPAMKQQPAIKQSLLILWRRIKYLTSHQLQLQSCGISAIS